MGFFDIIDPAIDSLKKLLKLDRDSYNIPQDTLKKIAGAKDDSIDSESDRVSSTILDGNDVDSESGFDLDAFVMERLSLDTSKLDVLVETPTTSILKRSSKSPRRIWRSENRSAKV